MTRRHLTWSQKLRHYWIVLPSATPAPANFAGCVQRSTADKNTVILSGETVCAKLTGAFSSEKIRRP